MIHCSLLVVIHPSYHPIDKLRRYFKQYGAVQDAAVMKDPISKRSRGFGFITFTDLNSVDHALAHEPHTIDSRKVKMLTC